MNVLHPKMLKICNSKIELRYQNAAKCQVSARLLLMLMHKRVISISTLYLLEVASYFVSWSICNRQVKCYSFNITIAAEHSIRTVVENSKVCIGKNLVIQYVSRYRGYDSKCVYCCIYIAIPQGKTVIVYTEHTTNMSFKKVDFFSYKIYLVIGV